MGASLSYPEPDLSGKVALVTGGNAGIGYETAKTLAKLGAHTFIGCRSKEKAEEAIGRIKAELSKSSQEKLTESGNKEASENKGEQNKESSGEDEETSGQGKNEDTENEEVRSKETSTSDCIKEIKLEFLPLDLASFQSTIDCVKAFKERNLPLHILVNNAGIFAIPYRKTDDGHETHFQVNHLCPLLLTLELLPILLETAASSGDGRIVFVSSTGHSVAATFDAENIESTEEGYKRLGTYNTTKLYNVMTGYALQRKLPESSSITVSSVDPGFVNTSVNRGIADNKFVWFMHSIASSAVGRSPEKGAATSLNAAVNPVLNSHQHIYYASCKPKESSADSRNESFQEELWKRSLEILKDRLASETWEKYGPKQEAAAE